MSLLGVGAQAAFGYAQTIYLLPMSLLGTGEAAASLPEMAEETAEEDAERIHARIRQRLGASLARVTILTIPTTFALCFLGHEIIRVLLQSGSFDTEATQRVDRLLVAYSFALLGNASGRVLTTTAYAIGDTKTPARYAIYRVIASTVGAVVLMQSFDAMGVVLGAVIAAWVETIALGLKLRARLGGLGLEQVPLGKALALGALSLAPALGLSHVLPESFARSFVGASLVLGAFCTAFAVAAPALGLFNVRSLLRRRR